jgi:DNA repair protein RadD
MRATRIMLQAPTGAGKTVLAASMVEDKIEFGNRVAFVVSDLSLIDQTIAAFNAQGISDIGIIQADHPGWNHNAAVQICSIQTLSRRGAPSVDFVLVDEAHKWHKAHEEWFSLPEMAAIPVIGLTATSWRKGPGKCFQKLVKVTSTETLITEKYLSPFRAYAPAHPDLTGVKIVAGDYHEGQLSKAMNKAPFEYRDNMERAGGQARPRSRSNSRRRGSRRDILIVFSDRIERLEVKQAFHTGEIILTTGIDWDVRVRRNLKCCLSRSDVV